MFPKNSKSNAALGREGTRATDNPAVYLPGQNIAADGGVTAARFVWRDSASASNSIYTPVKYKNSGAGVPAGIVEANIQTYIGTWEDATMTIPEAMPLLIIERGDVFMKTSTSAQAGDAVFASLTDGSVSTAAAGSTVAGSVETNFTVKTGGQAGGIIVISNW